MKKDIVKLRTFGAMKTPNLFNVNKLRASAAILLLLTPSTPLAGQSGVPAGAAISVSAGRFVVTGPDHAGLAGSFSTEAAFRFTTPWRIQIAGVGHYSRFPINGTNDRLSLITFVVEPRFQLLPSRRRLSPYVGFRLGPVWETLQARGADLFNRGSSFGGSLGFEFAAGEQVGLEFGASMDRMSFGEFDVQGSTAWESCLSNLLPPGPTMVQTIQTCVPFVNRVLAQVGAGPRGTLVSIPQPGTETTGKRLGLWIRLSLYLQPN